MYRWLQVQSHGSVMVQVWLFFKGKMGRSPVLSKKVNVDMFFLIKCFWDQLSVTEELINVCLESGHRHRECCWRLGSSVPHTCFYMRHSQSASRPVQPVHGGRSSQHSSEKDFELVSQHSAHPAITSLLQQNQPSPEQLSATNDLMSCWLSDSLFPNKWTLFKLQIVPP